MSIEIVCIDRTNNLAIDKKKTLYKFLPTGQHVETVVCLSQQKPDDLIEIEIDLDEIDATGTETKATYKEIQDGLRR